MTTLLFLLLLLCTVFITNCLLFILVFSWIIIMSYHTSAATTSPPPGSAHQVITHRGGQNCSCWIDTIFMIDWFDCNNNTKQQFHFQVFTWSLLNDMKTCGKEEWEWECQDNMISAWHQSCTSPCTLFFLHIFGQSLIKP